MILPTKFWPAAGFVDTEIGCFMKPEVGDGTTQVWAGVQDRGGSADQGARRVSVAQAARDLDVHENVLRKWVKEFAADPGRPSPATGR